MRAGSGYSIDQTIGRDGSYDVITVIGYVDVAVLICKNCIGLVEQCAGGGGAVGAKTLGTGAGNGCDNSGCRIYAPDGIVPGFCKKDVSGSIGRNTVGIRKGSTCSRPIVATVTICAGACYGSDVARSKVYFSYPLVIVICDIEVVCRIGTDAMRV